MHRKLGIAALALLVGFVAMTVLCMGQPDWTIEDVTAPITVERATGTLTIVSGFSGTVFVDDVEIASASSGEEILLGNVPSGLRRIELRGAESVASIVVEVKKDCEVAVTIEEDGSASSSIVSRRSPYGAKTAVDLGAGGYFYDMEILLVSATIAYSRYVEESIGLGAFVGIDGPFGVSKIGAQMVIGDTRSAAAGIRIGSYLIDGVPLFGVCAYFPGFWIAVEHSLADPGWAGEIHFQLGYSFRF